MWMAVCVNVLALRQTGDLSRVHPVLPWDSSVKPPPPQKKKDKQKRMNGYFTPENNHQQEQLGMASWNCFSRSTLTLATNSEGQSQELSQEKYSCPPRRNILLWSLKLIIMLGSLNLSFGLTLTSIKLSPELNQLELPSHKVCKWYLENCGC